MRSFKPAQTNAGREIDLRTKRPGGNADGRYNSTAYRKARAKQLERYPYCQRRTHCQGAKATQVNHKRPLRGPGDPGLADPKNLESTCQACNVAESWERRRLKKRKKK